MKSTVVVAGMFLAATSGALAIVRYVDVNSANPTPPYTNWATAAADIQDAVDAAGAGDEIVVTDGTYAPVTVNTPLTVQSVNGPDVTVIDGLGTAACLYLGNDAIVGFTLTNGGVGGVYCESSSSLLSNCVLSGNSTYFSGGGAYGGTLNNCTLNGNSAQGDGGGACDSTLNNCTLTGNSALDDGGGASSCTLNNCILYFNSALNGDNYDPSSTLNYCCTTPMPTTGVGNISVDPQLASASHLSAESPCIGAGSASYVSGTDIDGDAWANPPSIGCDEYHAGAVTGPLTVSLTATFTNVAIGFPVRLTAFIEGRTDLSLWVFGDGFVEVNEPYTSHAWTAPGDYLLELWTFNDSYPEGVSSTVTMHVDQGLHYVAASSGNPVAPYTSWATAATNIQEAVDVAGVGGTVFVTNGTYAGGSEADPYGFPTCVVVNTPLTLQSVNGPDVTIIDGRGLNLECLYLTNNTVIVGFTLTNGGAGGVYCESSSAVLSNCVLSGNLRRGAYGGTLNNCKLTGNSTRDGGGASYCTLNNCMLASNSATLGGGGAYYSTLSNCTLAGNSADDEGGGAYYSMLDNCTLTGNSTGDDGGGATSCTLNNCTLTHNSASWGGGAVAYSILNNCKLASNSAGLYGGGAYSGWLNNCTLTGNSTDLYGGGAIAGTLNNCALTGNSAWNGGGAEYCTLNNCTLTGNSAIDDGGGAYSCSLNNCIVYFNSDPNGGNYDTSSTLNYCCATPMPTGGIGNINNTPLFVDYVGGNLRLQSNSPCINSGNNAHVVGSSDLDGNPRIVGGTVDIGAYEYQTPVSMISYAWLLQYGLPINTNTDTTDLDGTGMNVYQDWIAGLNPTNALSVLKMLPPTATNNPFGLVVSWQGVSNITYFLQCSTNLAAQPAFSTVQSNIAGQAGTTSYVDTNATNAGPYFYRVGVGN